MKIILSRKGFDSQYGKIPSPILPDGTLLSLPIPECIKDPEDKPNPLFRELKYRNQSYFDIILNLKGDMGTCESDLQCHLDPDIRKDVLSRDVIWVIELFNHQSENL